MYYYRKTKYGQEFLKVNQTKIPAEGFDEEGFYIIQENDVSFQETGPEPGAPIVLESVSEPPIYSGGDHRIIVFDEGEMRTLKGSYKTKDEAASMLRGLSLIYEYVAVVKTSKRVDEAQTHDLDSMVF